jgi:acyl dehydratase
MDTQYFEDFEVGRKVEAGEYAVTPDEVIQYATKWDPQPFHIDENAAKASVYGGLTACGSHIMAIRTLLLHKSHETRTAAIMGTLGWDELRFPNPVRPGDRLSLTRECIEKRESRSRPDRGIVLQLIVVANQTGDPVLVHKDTILVAKRPDPRESRGASAAR